MRKKTKFYTFSLIFFIILSIFLINFLIKGKFTFAEDIGMQKNTVKINNEDRNFYVHLPETYIKEKKDFPVVLIFHGSVADANKIKNYTKFNDFADKNDIIVVYPENLGNCDWDLKTAEESKDLIFIRQLINTIGKKYKVDKNRIYATGYSSGAEMIYLAACTLNDKIAAFAPVAGNMRASYVSGCKNSKPVPILLIHGTEDPYEKWDGDPSKEMLSVQEVLNFWKSKNKNIKPEQKQIIYPYKDPSNIATTAQLEICDFAKNKTEVSILKILNGGHTWPSAPTSLRIETFLGKTNYDVNANEIIWDFFKKYKLNSKVNNPSR
jgi:polyhydroxybutyrate depolymerase